MLKFQKAGNLVNKSNAIQSAIKDIWILLVSAAGHLSVQVAGLAHCIIQQFLLTELKVPIM